MQHIVGFLPKITLDEERAAFLVQQGSLGSRQALQEQFMFTLQLHNALTFQNGFVSYPREIKRLSASRLSM
jgi:hypothetical protein